MRYFVIPLKFSVYIPNVLNLRICLYRIYPPIIDTQQVQQVSTVTAKLPQMTNKLVIPELIRSNQPLARYRTNYLLSIKYQKIPTVDITLHLRLFIKFISSHSLIQKILPSPVDNPLGRVYHLVRRVSMGHRTAVEKLERRFVSFPMEKSLRQSRIGKLIF